MRKNIFCTLLLLLSLSISAQVDRSKQPAPGPAPEIKLGNYESFVLPNGLKVFVIENNKLPVISFSLIFNYDVVLEGVVKGYADFTGQLLKTGTTTRTKDQIDEQIDFIGAALNTSLNSMYASSLKKHTEKLLGIVSDIVINANFKQEELDKIKKQAKSALEAIQNDPNALSERVSPVVIFSKKHPYGEIMTEKSVDNVTLDICTNYYKSFFRPNISYLAIVGNTTMKEIKPLIEKYFGKWQKAEVPKNAYPTPIAPPLTAVAMVDKSDAVQSVINVTYPVDLKPGEEDAVKVRVMNAVLGGGIARLFVNLREKHGWTYGAYSAINPDILVSNFKAYTSVRNSVTDSALTEILGEMNRLVTEKVPEKELELVKNYISGNFALSLEEPQTLANFAINIERYNLPKDYYATYLKKIAAVTPDDVQAMAKKFIKPDNAYIFIVGNSSEIADKVKKFSVSGPITYYDFNGETYNYKEKLKPAPSGITAESIIKNYIEAIGGEKSLGKINDYSTKLKGKVQGMELTFTFYKKAPNKSLLEASMNGKVVTTRIFDGTSGKIVSPMGTQDLKDKELTDMKIQSVMFLELKYAELGIKINLLGTEKINDKEAYKIEFLTPNGNKYYYYFDITTGLKVRAIEGEGGTIDYSDYKEIKGVKFPFTQAMTFGSQTVGFSVESLEVNTNIKDDFFFVK
ncbi:MAG: insulinase family protein [Bacteroidales bacterium]|nr:insulinase family protein [Bacteroidales bacterium]